jgi:hypothetical protein
MKSEMIFGEFISTNDPAGDLTAVFEKIYLSFIHIEQQKKSIVKEQWKKGKD